jgi:type IV secretion system protein VirB8
MSQTSGEQLDALYADTNSWAQDMRERDRRQGQRLAIATWIFAAIALIEAFAIFLMLPLKTVVPYTLLVDRQTGYVEEIDPLTIKRIPQQDALTKSFLVQYVMAREGYDRMTVKDNYRKVALWSSGKAQKSYLTRMQPSNPNNPVALYSVDGQVAVTILSVSLTDEGRALVRYQLSGGRTNRPDVALGQYAAVVGYIYRDRPLTVSDRLINPLGFEVTAYRSDPEIAPPLAEPQPAPEGPEVETAPAEAPTPKAETP